MSNYCPVGFPGMMTPPRSRWLFLFFSSCQILVPTKSEDAVSGTRNWVLAPLQMLIDACFSGGLIEELLEALPHVVGTTTCTKKGYGYDNEATHSGAWTDAFLTRGLRPAAGQSVDLAALYAQTQARYCQEHGSRGDRPCFFARTAGVAPCNTEAGTPVTDLPLRTFLSRDWLV